MKKSPKKSPGAGNAAVNRSVIRALKILECFSEKEPELSVSEISQRVGVSGVTVSRLVNSLVHMGYLVPGSTSGRFTLGLKPLGVSRVVLNTSRLRAEAIPFLRTIAHETQANANLGVLDGSEVVYLARVSSPRVEDVYVHTGRRAPVHCTALGKILLAFAPPEVRQRALSVPLVPFTQRTITDREVLLQQLEEIRSRGWAEDRGEYMETNDCLAVPVWDSTGCVAAALSISTIRALIEPGELIHHRELLMRVSQQLSYKLGVELFHPAVSSPRGPLHG